MAAKGGSAFCVQEVFHERVKSYKNWKEAETMLGKKREAKAKYEVLNKSDKAAQVKQEITEVYNDHLTLHWTRLKKRHNTL